MFQRENTHVVSILFGYGNSEEKLSTSFSADILTDGRIIYFRIGIVFILPNFLPFLLIRRLK